MADRCEGDPESDLNCMASVILRQYTTVKNSASNCPGPERDVLSIAIADLILRSALVCFSLLHASYYYNLTGFVCYVYLV